MTLSIGPPTHNPLAGIPIFLDGRHVLDDMTTLVYANEDRSRTTTLRIWEITRREDLPDGIRLWGRHFDNRLETWLDIQVAYRVINSLVIRKEVTLHQANIPLLFAQVAHTLRPVRPPENLWSFDCADHRGGTVHGTYPAIGFTDGASFGLLSDGGHRNHFTRNIRRRPDKSGHGFTAMQRTCDAEMLTLSKEAVTLQLGNLLDYAHGERREMGSLSHSFGPLYHAFEGADGYYTLSFEYQTEAPLHLRIQQGTPDGEVRAFHYQDDLPASPDRWAEFSDTFFLSDAQGLPTLAKIWQGDSLTPRIRNLRLTRHVGESTPYHLLPMGQPQTKTTFLFAEAGSDLRALRLASQLRLAEGLGFQGSDPLKVLFADMQMLTWITGEHDFTPLNVPSINYAPDMYNRDSFWSVMGIEDAPLSKAVFDRWGATQTREGGIGTIVTPMMGSTEVKDNEATCEWLWWALVNRQRYGIQPPAAKIRLAFDYCVAAFDPERTGTCHAHFVLGQNDVTTYPDQPTTDLAVNQGMWSITLKVAKALGLHADQTWIDRASAGYRAFYDPLRGYLLNDRLHPDTISFNDLLPEFVSLWLFDEAILTDEMVVNTLDKLPHNGPLGFLIGHVRDGYFTEETKPCDGHFSWPRGVYYNGASWMREEVMGYAAGVRHGWIQGRSRIAQRLRAELDAKPAEPFSHEFIPTDPSVEGCWWPSTRVFCWNVFALVACQVAGMPSGEE